MATTKVIAIIFKRRVVYKLLESEIADREKSSISLMTTTGLVHPHTGPNLLIEANRSRTNS